MKTLFVEKKAMELRYERACLLVYQEGKRVTSVPVVQLERIVVAPHVALSAGVLGLVAEHNVALLVLNSRFPDRSAMLSGAMPGDVHRRVAQYGLLDDMPLRLMWFRQLVCLKITRQYKLLAQALIKRPDLRYGLTHALDQLGCALVSLKLADNIATLASLRGVEGAASATYFKAFAGLFPDSLNFNNRNRRPPKDPVNACLSLTYTLSLSKSGRDIGMLTKWVGVWKPPMLRQAQHERLPRVSTAVFRMMHTTLYLLNAPILTAFGLWRFAGPLMLSDVQDVLKNGFVSGVGHQATADYLSELLSIACPFNRQRISMQAGDSAIVLRLLCRLPEGKLLEPHEIKLLPYQFGLLQRLE